MKAKKRGVFSLGRLKDPVKAKNEAIMSAKLSKVIGYDEKIWFGPGSPQHDMIIYLLIVKCNKKFIYVGKSGNWGRRLEGHEYKFRTYEDYKGLRSLGVKDFWNDLDIKPIKVPVGLFSGLYEKYLIQNMGTLNDQNRSSLYTDREIEKIIKFEEMNNIPSTIQQSCLPI